MHTSFLAFSLTMKDVDVEPEFFLFPLIVMNVSLFIYPT